MARSRARALVRFALRSPAERVLRAVVRLLPRRVQQMTVGAVQPLMDRWPLLARLLGDAPFPGEKTRVQSVAATVAVVVSPIEPPVPGVAPAAEPAVALVAVAVAPVDPVVAPVDAVVAPAASLDEEAPESTLRNRQAAPPPPPRVPEVSAVDKAAAAELVQALRSASAEVAVEATISLRHYPGEQAIGALRDVIENRDGYFNLITRASAVRTLGTLLPVGMGQPIAAAVFDSEAEVSVAAIATLVERNEEVSHDALMGVLENGSGFFLPLARRAAARGLLRLEVPWQPRLQRLLDMESDADIREILSALCPQTRSG